MYEHRIDRPDSPELDRIIEQSRKANLAAQRREAGAAVSADRAQRFEDARGLLAALPDWTRPLPEEKLLEGIPEGFETQAQHWTPRAGGLLLVGPTGIGKTAAAAALVKRLLRLGVKRGGPDWSSVCTLSWWYVPDLVGKRRQHPTGKGEAPAVEEAISASLLVLDDIGLGRDVETVSYVLAKRYDARRITIATSGFSHEELARHYSAMVLRKLLNSGGIEGTIVEKWGDK